VIQDILKEGKNRFDPYQVFGIFGMLGMLLAKSKFNKASTEHEI